MGLIGTRGNSYSSRMETPTAPRSPRRIALQACIGAYVEDEELKKRRRGMSKTQLVKRLRLSLHDWQSRRNRLDRRTTARESTIALLKKVKNPPSATKSDPVDPITRERLSRESNDRVFTFRRGSTIARIDASALIDYILSTGDYADPESRIPFDDCALARLDQLGAALGKPSVLKARSELQSKYTERQFLRDALCGLERVCGESVSQMFDLVEQVNEDVESMDDAQVQLLTFIIPEFQGNFSQLVEADKAYAKHSAMQFEAFLKGPPNRPIKQTPIQLLVLEMFRNAVDETMS